MSSGEEEKRKLLLGNDEDDDHRAPFQVVGRRREPFAMTAVALHRPNPTDADLMARVAAGELGGLGVLFDRYGEDVERVVSRLGVPAAEIDDLVQVTFLEIVRSAPSFDGRASAKNWVLGIAAMVVRRHRRSLMRLTRALLRWANEPTQAEETPSHSFEIQESAALASRALACLSAKKRETFVMVVLEGVSGEDAARILGIPVATVWTRLHHARLELRAHLNQERP